MDLIFVTGIAGTEKGATIVGLVEHAVDQGYAREDEIAVFHVEEYLQDEVDYYNFLTNWNPAVQRLTWSRAAQSVADHLADALQENRALRFAIIVFHYQFFVRDRMFTVTDWSALRRLCQIARVGEEGGGRAIFVTLQDDSYAVWSRIMRNSDVVRDLNLAGNFHIRDCVIWRWNEVDSTEQCALSLLPGVPLEYFTISVNHSPDSVARLFFQQDARRAYLCFPISGPRRDPESYPPSSVNDFRYRVQEVCGYVAFDPLGLDEELMKLLYTDRQKSGSRNEDPIVIAESANDYRDVGRKRWKIPQDKRLLRDDVLKRLGRPVMEYPLELPYEEVEDAYMVAHNHVAPRDLKWVDQADCVAVYRPFWGDDTHRGVFTEIRHAQDSQKRVIAYWPPEDGDSSASPFTAMQSSSSEDEFYDALVRFEPPRIRRRRRTSGPRGR